MESSTYKLPRFGHFIMIHSNLEEIWALEYDYPKRVRIWQFQVIAFIWSYL